MDASGIDVRGIDVRFPIKIRLTELVNESANESENEYTINP